MNVKSHNRSKNVYFYQIGLGDKDEVNDRKWRMKTFSTMLKENGHNKVNGMISMKLAIPLHSL